MARVIAFAPNGDVFVSSPGMVSPGGTGPGIGAIVALPDDDRDGAADEVSVFAQGLATVHGLAFDGSSLLYTLHESVRRAPYAAGDRRASTTVASHIQVADLRGTVRWTHTLARAEDGTVYVSVGNYGLSTCPGRERDLGGVLRLDGAATTGVSRVVTGLRNPLYLRCVASGCFGIELPDDAWQGTSERIIPIRQGDDYAYPCCEDRGVAAPGGRGSSCAAVPEPVLRIEHHSVALGFDRAPDSWPEPYRGGWFVA